MDPVPRDAERPRPLRWDPLQWLAAAFAVVLIGVLAGALLGKLAWTWISPFTFLTFSANMASQANRHRGIPGKETEANSSPPRPSCACWPRS